MSSKTVGMNSIGYFFFCQEDVVTSQGLHSSIRFKTKHSPEEIRGAMRYMITVYPRLRSIVEPTFFSYRMRILDDNDPLVDVLFNEAFKVKHGLQYGTDDYLKYRRDLINEPYALQQALPVKIRYIPDDPMPVLFISVHHMLYDGSGWMHLINSLVSYLNGIKPPIQSAHEPSLIKGFLARPFYMIPLQLMNAFKPKNQENIVKDKKAIISASSRPVNFFGPVDTHNQNSSHDITTLLAGAKRLNCSVTVLLLTALVMSFGKKEPGKCIGIEMPIDMRPFFPSDKKPVFCNCVMAPLIKVDMDEDLAPLSIIKTIKNQINHHIQTLENKEILSLLLLVKLSTFIGKKNYTRLARLFKERGIVQKTCMFSNLGNLDFFNSHGSKSQVFDACTMTSSHALLLTLNSLDGFFNFTFSYQEAEFVREDIINIMDKIDRAIASLLDIKYPAA